MATTCHVGSGIGIVATFQSRSERTERISTFGSLIRLSCHALLTGRLVCLSPAPRPRGPGHVDGIEGGSRHQAATQDGRAILEYRQPRPIRNVARLAIRADLCPFALTHQRRQCLVYAVGPQAAVSGVRAPRIPCLTLALA